MPVKFNRLSLAALLSGVALIILSFNSSAQNAGIGAVPFVPNPAAMLDVQSAGNKGLLIPRVTNAQRMAMNPLPAAAQGLLLYQTDVVGTSLQGFYYNTSGTTTPVWVYLDPGGSGGSGWNLSGNAGTTPAANFIGTTDSQDWVMRTNNQERARYLSTGELRINTTSPYSGEVVTVVGSGASGATASVGTDALNGYSTAAGIGVYGYNNGTGTGVWGVSTGSSVGTRGDNTSASTANSTTTHGVYGSNSSVPSGTGITIGVGGYATAASLDARGVNGQSQSTNGIGVAGFNTSASAANFGAYGVYGQTSSQSAGAVAGVNTSVAGAAHGVEGTTSSAFGGAGVRGYNNSAPSTSSSYGVKGSANGIPGLGGSAYGVRGECSTITGTAYGVSGAVGTPTGFGVHAYNSNASGTALIGSGNGVGANYMVNGSGGAFTGSSTGALALGTTGGSSTGMLGVSNGATLTTLVTGSGVSGSSDLVGVAGWASSFAAADRAGGYFDANAGASYAYVGAITSLGTNRKIEGNGTVNTTVRDLNNKLVVLSCPESPENLFQDFGRGALVNGKAHIALDPVFSKNIRVDDIHPLRVFIQLGGDCNGVYVDHESSSGFDVTELQQGASSAPFTWFVTANRADEQNPDGSVARYSEERFAPAMGPKASARSQIRSFENPAPQPDEHEPKALLPGTTERTSPKIPK